jgi:hypothetical protein
MREKILNDLKNRSNHDFSNASEIALIYAGLHAKDQAMTWMERAYEERFNPAVLLRPAFDPLRSDPRFKRPYARAFLTIQRKAAEVARGLQAQRQRQRRIPAPPCATRSIDSPVVSRSARRCHFRL